MQALLDLLDVGGLSLGTAAARLGITEGQALAALVPAGRTVRVDGAPALAAVRSWGRVRVIVRAGACMAEVMCDLAAAREAGGRLDHVGEEAHLHFDLREVVGAYVTAKAGHVTGRTVRMVAFVDREGEVLFKVMVPKERADLVGPFNQLRSNA